MDKNTPKAKGLRTAYQTVAGLVVSFVTGLIALPEVREYTETFVRTQGLAALLALLGLAGVSAGVLAFIQNRLEK